MGLKCLAREIGVDQGHLSRVERGVVPASEQLVRNVAGALETDPESLLVASGRLPSDIRQYFVSYPTEAVALLREEFGHYGLALPEGNPAPARPTEEFKEERPCRRHVR
jgi:transcriptional regulator with XRE-family HTH domain